MKLSLDTALPQGCRVWTFREGFGNSYPWPGNNPGFEELVFGINGDFTAGRFPIGITNAIWCFDTVPTAYAGRVQDAFDFAGETKLSLELWYKLSAAGVFYALYNTDFIVECDSIIQVSLPTNAGNIEKLVAGLTPDTAWHHLVVTANLSAVLGLKIKIYLDGECIDSGNETGFTTGTAFVDPSNNTEFCRVDAATVNSILGEVGSFPGWTATASDVVRLKSKSLYRIHGLADFPLRKEFLCGTRF